MTVGEHIKVHLIGEALWAICEAIHDDGTWTGTLDNNPVLNGAFKMGDRLRFERGTGGWAGCWVPKEPEA